MGKKGYYLFFMLIGLLPLCYYMLAKASEKAWEFPEVLHPADNLPTDERVHLGSDLFSETLFSRDSTISCQSCHKIDEAFADHLPLGEGIKGRHVSRNTPSLLNVGLHPYLMKDGKSVSLEEQVLLPINEHREFDMNPELLIDRLKSREYYTTLSQQAYGKDIDIDVVKKALAVFQRVLKSENSRFDAYMRGDEQSLTVEEKKGWVLFKSDRLQCSKCHMGFDFTDYSFQNNGLYSNYLDSGRALVTGRKEDIAKFKVPSLRNVAITYPYMHDGSVESLEEVIAHYASGGKKHENQSEYIEGFELNEEEKSALIAFLHSLTESSFLNE